MRACTKDQIEEAHPGVKGRLSQWIYRADAGDPEMVWLKFAIIRIGRTVLIDDVRFRDGLYQRTAIPAAPARRIAPEAALPAKGGSGKCGAGKVKQVKAKPPDAGSGSGALAGAADTALPTTKPEDTPSTPVRKGVT